MIAYMSQTGNTEKIARAIFQVVQTKKCLKKLNDLKSLKDYDLVFVGFPIHNTKPAKPAKDFLVTNVQGKKVALFVTHATREDSKALQKWLTKCREAAVGSDMVGFFNCQGKIDASRLERARRFAEGVMEKIGLRPKKKNKGSA